MQTDNKAVMPELAQQVARGEITLDPRRQAIAQRAAVTDPRTVAGVKRKYYNRLDQAERYQNWLYGRFNSVTLIESPRFSEGGYYAWEVS